MANKCEFFMPMVPPTKTYQEHKVAVVNGKPVFYEPQELKEAKSKLMAYLAKNVPDKKFNRVFSHQIPCNNRFVDLFEE